MTRVRLALGKFVLLLYRLAGIGVLYSVLVLIAGYTVVIGFYAVNSGWIAPFIVTPTTDKILDMTTKLVTSQEVLGSLIVDRDRLEGSLGDLRKTKAQLDQLDRNFRTAIVVQKVDDAQDSPELTALRQKKVQDNANTDKVVTGISEVEASIDKDYAAGLITKADAALAKTQLQATYNMATNGKIEEVLLRDNERQKQPNHTVVLDTLAKQAELEGNLFQINMQISSGEEQLAQDKIQIATLQGAITTAQDSPYFLATKADVRFAFVPYDNASGVKVDVPVYGCWLNMVICHKVGTIKHIFKDEEKITHPIFKTDVRGFVVQLDLWDREAAKDKVLFLGHRPLLF
jgi:hypothetical protein